MIALAAAKGAAIAALSVLRVGDAVAAQTPHPSFQPAAAMTVEEFLRLRDGATRLRDVLSQLVIANGYDPRPNSPAAVELQTFARPQSVHTAHGQAWMLVEVTADQLTAFLKTVTEPVETVAPYTCVRSLLEAAALSCWLLDPDVDAQTRVGRSIALRYQGMEQQLKWARSAGEDPQKASVLLDNIAKVATSLGYPPQSTSHGKRIGAGTPMPAVTELIRDMLGEEPLYRLLSAVAHGHHWAIQKLSFARDPRQDTLSPISGEQLRGVTKEPNLMAMGMLAFESALALARVTWYQALYLGWDRNAVVAVLDSHFHEFGAQQAVRFWRAST